MTGTNSADDRLEREHIVNGALKWFSPRLGYGFLVDDETQDDVLLTVDRLKHFGWNTVAKGSRIAARTIATARGLQVHEIIDIQTPSDLDESRVFAFDELDHLSDEFVSAEVDWYDRKKGYGFAFTLDDGENCFIHWTALAEAGLLRVTAGETIAVRVGHGKRGRVAASIRPLGEASLDAGAPSLAAA